MVDGVNMGVAVWASVLYRLSIMMLVGVATFCLALMLGKRLDRERPRGVVVFGVLLIMGSFYKLWGLSNYEYYQFMFQQLSEKTIFVRYILSFALRFVGVMAATGVLVLKDGYRKLFMLLCLGTICLIWCKHPIFVFENISKLTDQQFLNKAVGEELTHSSRHWISLIFNYTVDIIFAGSALYYFSRPNVKKQFN